MCYEQLTVKWSQYCVVVSVGWNRYQLKIAPEVVTGVRDHHNWSILRVIIGVVSYVFGIEPVSSVVMYASQVECSPLAPRRRPEADEVVLESEELCRGETGVSPL